MDLPSCPSCKQSVLDDDAEFCPFCGASMSGKPGAAPKKPAQQPAKPKPGPSAPATSAKPGKPVASGGGNKTAAASKPAAATPAPPPAEDDDPFAVAQREIADAVPASPRRTKSRPHPVTCPMCETVGYVPESASGKNIRCANAECLVPLFTAPRFAEPEPEPVAPEPAKFSASRAIFIALILLIAIGAGTWGYFIWQDNREPVIKENPNQNLALDLPAVTPVPAETNKDLPKPTPEPAPTPVKADPTPQRIKTVLAEIDRAGFTEQALIQANLRRLVTDAFVLAGDPASIVSQFNALKVAATNTPDYQITPLIRQSWQQLQDGNVAAAQQSFQQAMTVAGKLRTDRYGIDCTIQLSVLAIALGQPDQASQLIRRHEESRTRETPTKEHLSSLHQQMRFTRTFDFARTVALQPMLDSESPLRLAITAGLCQQRYFAQALAFARSTADATVQADCLATYALHTAWANPGESTTAELQQEAAKLAPPLQIRFLAEAARGSLLAGNQPAALALLQQASTLLEGQATPLEIILPETVKETIALKLPNRLPLTASAVAAAAVAQVQAELGQTEAAWASLEKSLAYSRAVAPSLHTLRERLNRTLSQATTVEAEIAREYQLNSADSIRNQLKLYRDHLRNMESGSEQRLRLLGRFLLAGLGWNIRPQVETALPTWQTELATKTGDVAALATLLSLQHLYAHSENLTKLTGEPGPRGSKLQALMIQVRKLVQDGKFAQAAQLLDQRADQDLSTRTAWLLEAASLLVQADRISDAFTMGASLTNSGLVEEVLDAVAAQATRAGHGDAVWEQSRKSNLTQSARVALGHGYIVGLKTKP